MPSTLAAALEARHLASLRGGRVDTPNSEFRYRPPAHREAGFSYEAHIPILLWIAFWAVMMGGCANHSRWLSYSVGTGMIINQPRD